MIGLPYGEKNYDNTLSCFHTIPERNGRTDRQTDGQTDLLYKKSNILTSILQKNRLIMQLSEIAEYTDFNVCFSNCCKMPLNYCKLCCAVCLSSSAFFCVTNNAEHDKQTALLCPF